MNFADLITEDRRLVILRVLAEDPGYALNMYLIQDCLKLLGHAVSMDRVVTDLDWLAEQGLITVSGVSGVKVASLTVRGADVASGRAVVTGVKRPLPGE